MEGVRNEARLGHWMARDILAGRDSGGGDGLHVWLELPAYWNSSQLARAAGSGGTAVTPAEAFATGSGSVNAIRISLGSIKDRGRLQTGLQRAVSSACAAARVVQRCCGLTVQETLCFIREFSQCGRTWVCCLSVYLS